MRENQNAQMGSLGVTCSLGAGQPAVSEEAAPRASCRIVIVDDSLLIRYRVKHLLSHEQDFVVVGEADNGLDGVRLVHALRPDLVIMDIRMPLMDGVEATLLIKSESPDTIVIGLSSLRDPEIQNQFMSSGAADLVEKSGNWHRLVESARRCLEARALPV